MGLISWLERWADGVVKREELAKKRDLAQKLTVKLQKAINGITAAKTPKSRLTHCDSAVRLIYQLEDVDRETNVVHNKPELKSQLLTLRHWLPLIALEEKTRKLRACGEQKKELKALVELRTFMAAQEPSQEEWAVLEAMTQGTFSKITLSELDEEIKELNDQLHHNLVALK